MDDITVCGAICSGFPPLSTNVLYPVDNTVKKVPPDCK